MAVNVNRNVTDLFYRYKMPRLIAKVEGKGNGIKTVIVNMSEIAKSLSRPPTYPTKYFGCELGAQTQFDAANDRYIVNGAHDASRLQDLLDGFIKKFVLCPECDNPETNLNVYQKKQQIQQNCIACGHQANVDMRHKLTTFILKNPPEPESGIGSSEVATSKGEKAKKSGTKSKKSSGKNKESNDNGNGDAAQHDNNTDAQESKKNKSSRSSKNQDDYDDDDDWGEDISDAAVQARKDGLSTAVKSMTVSEDSEKSELDRINIFYSFVQQRKVAGQMTGGEKEKEVFLEAERLDIRDKAPLVLMELLFDANILQQIKQYKSLLRRFTNNNEKAQKYLLGGFEQLVGIVHPDVLIPKTPRILKMFYEEDILEEEAIIEWDKKPSKKYISKEVSKELHAKAEPFVKWLKEAEEESSDEDDDVEVVYTDSNATVASNPAAATTKTAPASGVGTANNNEEDDDDDLNIDDI